MIAYGQLYFLFSLLGWFVKSAISAEVLNMIDEMYRINNMGQDGLIIFQFLLMCTGAKKQLWQ